MNWRSKAEVRRCRPLLGTFVEVMASGPEENDVQAAVDSAFVQIERIQRLLSAHDPSSELSRLNRMAVLGPITVSKQTYALLRRANTLASESEGAFDHTIASVLAGWGFLPSHLRRRKKGSWRDVMLMPGCKIRFLRPLALDLGGIAKGFAVDVAIHALKRHGAETGTVNAGGDLRVFGKQGAIVHLRHPGRPQHLAGTIQLVDSALATSAPCFTEKPWRGTMVSHLVNPRARIAITGPTSVSVCARECWLADALTKVVLNAPQRAPKLLAKYRAEAFVLSA